MGLDHVRVQLVLLVLLLLLLRALGHQRMDTASSVRVLLQLLRQLRLRPVCDGLRHGRHDLLIHLVTLLVIVTELRLMVGFHVAAVIGEAAV